MEDRFTPDPGWILHLLLPDPDSDAVAEYSIEDVPALLSRRLVGDGVRSIGWGRGDHCPAGGESGSGQRSSLTLSFCRRRNMPSDP